VTTSDYLTGNRVGNVSFKLSGSKSIGNDSEGLPVLKYLASPATDSNGFVGISNVEWDSYWFSFATSTTYDLAGINPLNPVMVNAGSTTPVAIYVAQKSNHSLLVAVEQSDGMLVESALVQIERPGFTATSTTPAWGQVFFRDIEASTYDLTVTKTGFEDYVRQVTVSGATQEVVTMTPL